MYTTLVRYPKEYLPSFQAGMQIVLDDVLFTVKEYRELAVQSHGYKTYGIAGILFMKDANYGADVMARLRVGKGRTRLYFDRIRLSHYGDASKMMKVNASNKSN